MSGVPGAKFPSVSGLRSVHVGVVDFRNSVEFFTGTWGLSIVESSDRVAFLRGTGRARYVIALHKWPRTEILRVDLSAPDQAAVDAIHARLVGTIGANPTLAGDLPENGGGYGFKVRDPEGRLFLIVAGDESHSDTPDARDRPRKLSHVVLNTSDAPTLENFFTEGLGFRLVDRTRRMGFLNCCDDHHSLAIVPSNNKTLHHLAFEMPSFDALMRGIGRLRELGIEIGWGVGRHGPGNNIFAYFVGPENLPIEYTAEVQRIDETYRVGSPEDWKPVPGRMDQWGVTAPISPAMEEAEHTITFSDESL